MARPPAELAPVTTLGERAAGPADAAVPVVARPAADVPAARSRAGLRGVARGGMVGLAGAGVSAVSAVLVVVVLTRAVPAATAGTFFAVTSVFLLAQAVAKVGTPTSLVYFPARMRALGAPERIAGVLRLGLGTVSVVSVVVGAALWLCAPWLAGVVVAGSAAEVASAAEGLRVLALLVPVAALADAVTSATRGFDTMLPTVLLDRVGRSTLQLALLSVALLAGWTSAGLLVGAWALPYLLPLLLGSRDLAGRVRRAGAAAAGPDRDRAFSAGEFWRFSGPRAVAGVAQMALQRLDIVLVASLLGPVPAAVYTAATRVLVLGQLSNQAISSAVQPRLGALLATEDTDAANTVYRAATAWLVLLNWPLYLLTILFAPAVLGLFGAGYAEDGTTVAVVLGTAMLLASACGMVNLVLIMAGRSTVNLGNALLALGVNVAVDLLLIPAMGLPGAAIGWAAAIAVSNLVALAQIQRSHGLHPFGRGTLMAMALAMACFGVLPGGARLVLGSGLGPLLCTALVGTLCYAAVAYRWRTPLGLDVLGRRGARR